jgi:exosortase
MIAAGFGWLSAVLLFLHLPFVFGWAGWMWGREHYQYFPIVLAAFVFAVYSACPLSAKTKPAFSLLALIYWLVGVVVFVLAAFFSSHWLGMISLLLLQWGLAHAFLDEETLGRLRMASVLPWLVIPLPLNLDLTLITGLQHLAGWLASGSLDLCEVQHSVSGIAIRTADKSYMVEEACSGIHSLFSTISAMTFFALYCQYGLPRILLTLILSVTCVIGANWLRVFVIVYAGSRFQISLDSGLRHEAVGILTYLLALGMALSADQWFRFVFPIVEGSGKREFKQLYDQSFRTIRTQLQGAFGMTLLRGNAARFLTIATMGGVLLPSAAFGFVRVSSGRKTVVSVMESRPGFPATMAFSASSLPESIAGFQKVDFNVVNRSPDDAFGMTSYVWRFRNGGVTATVSLDGPYNEFHDLAYCYTGAGWKLQASENGSQPGVQTPRPHTLLQLYKPQGEYAVVFFSCFDSQSVVVQPPVTSGSLLRSFTNRIADAGLIGRSNQPVIPPVFQVQVFGSDVREFLPHEFDNLSELFYASRSVLFPITDSGNGG